jgi:hypothetical protein
VSEPTPLARLIVTTIKSDMAKKFVVTEYIFLDGVIEDPAGMENPDLCNWTEPVRRGPETNK